MNFEFDQIDLDHPENKCSHSMTINNASLFDIWSKSMIMCLSLDSTLPIMVYLKFVFIVPINWMITW